MAEGYQSNLSIEDLDFIGDFPIENSLGGYGETTGADDDYELTLNPPISAYRVGMHLQMKFNHANLGATTLNVDGQGASPVMKIVSNALAALEAGDLNITRVYDLIYDGMCFQLTSGIASGLPQASEGTSGIAEVATQAEVDAGTDNTRMVTPQKMAQYVSERITDLWENRGLYDCSTDPDYPPGVSGDAYTVRIGGRIGGAAGVEVGPRDVFYCINDNAGGSEAAVGLNWGVIQSNLDQATEDLAGTAEIATDGETTAGVNDTTIVTPLKLYNLLNSLTPTEMAVGLTEIATQAEVNAGLDDVRIVTPLKLETRLGAALSGSESNLGNPSADGYVLQSTQAGVRSWRATNSRLFTSYTTAPGLAGTDENDLGSTYTMPAATLDTSIGDQALEIEITGTFNTALGDKTIRVYIGNELIFVYTTNVIGDWSVRVLGGRVSSGIFKGAATIIHAGNAESHFVQTTNLGMDTTDQLIRITHQNTVDALGQVSRYTFIVRHIV